MSDARVQVLPEQGKWKIEGESTSRLHATG